MWSPCGADAPSTRTEPAASLLGMGSSEPHVALWSVWGHQGWAGSPRPSPSPSSPAAQQNKMEDHLDEAIHVLRSHAVGTAGDVHGLLPSHGTLASSFASPVMPLGGRHDGLVCAGQGAGAAAGGGGGPDSLLPVHRLQAATQRTALRAAAASCTATWPCPASPVSSPTSRGHPTPTAVSPSVVPGWGGSILASVTCA